MAVVRRAAAALVRPIRVEFTLRSESPATFLLSYRIASQSDARLPAASQSHAVVGHASQSHARLPAASQWHAVVAHASQSDARLPAASQWHAVWAARASWQPLAWGAPGHAR